MPAPSLKTVRPAALRLSFSPEAASARQVSGEIRAFLADQGVPAKELFSYELCVAEACYNAIENAKGAARELEPVAEVLFSRGQIELRVTDHTPGFAMPERLASPSPMVDRGRGLFLIQSVMDEVRYLRGPTENILVMRKARRPVDGPLAPQESGPGDFSPDEDSRQLLAEARRSMEIMASELSLRSEALSAIFRCCAELGRVEEVSDGFGERLLRDLLHITSSDWYVLRLISPDNRQLAVAATSESGIVPGPIDLPLAGEAPRGLEASAAVGRTQARYEARDWADDSEPLRAVAPLGTGLVCPLCFGGMVVGTIAVGRRDGDVPLRGLQDEVIRAFAEFLAIQTLNFQHRSEEVRKRAVARELEVAREIQQLLLPRTLPQLPGIGLTGGWQSAREVGGDFYDAITLGGQSLYLMIADVMGKGVPAALFATTMRGLLRGLTSRSADPAQLLTSLNRLLYRELSAVNMFITAQIAHVDLQSRVMTIANAGHCPLLVVNQGPKGIAALTTQGVPIGVLPETVYHHSTHSLGPSATLLMHTDGLTDTRNSAGRMFGQRRLMAWLRSSAVPGRSSAELSELLTAELGRFRGEAALADDQAFLLLSEERAGAPPAAEAGRRRIPFQRGSFLFPVNA